MMEITCFTRGARASVVGVDQIFQFPPGACFR